MKILTTMMTLVEAADASMDLIMMMKTWKKKVLMLKIANRTMMKRKIWERMLLIIKILNSRIIERSSSTNHKQYKLKNPRS